MAIALISFKCPQIMGRRMVVIRWNKRRLFLLLATYLLLNVASSLVNIARSRAQIFACKKRERVVRERMERSVILGGQDSPRKWETIEGGRGSPLCCEEQSTRGRSLEFVNGGAHRPRFVMANDE